MLASNEEIIRLFAENVELKEKNIKLELMLYSLEALKQDNKYLKKKLECEEKVKSTLTAKLDENELKIKAYQNSSNIVRNIGKAQSEPKSILKNVVKTPTPKQCVWVPKKV